MFLLYMVSAGGQSTEVDEKTARFRKKISQGIVLCDMINLVCKNKIKDIRREIKRDYDKEFNLLSYTEAVRSLGMEEQDLVNF